MPDQVPAEATRSPSAAQPAGTGDAADLCPRRSDLTEWRKVGEDTLVLHLTLKQYHILNHVAGRIWDLCDGSRSLNAIAEELAGAFRTDASAVYPDVADTVETFAGMGILQTEAAA